MEPSLTRTHRKPVVLITRPQGQHIAFAQQSQELGFATALLPCVEIQHCHNAEDDVRKLTQTHDAVLFTSANAVRHAHIIQPLPWPDIDTHAIGVATARLLADFGQCVTLPPKEPYNSEAYLAQTKGDLPDSLLIIKGTGGRALIETQLRQEGVDVNTLDVYERCKPCVHADIISDLFVVPPDIICVTSDEILITMWQLCSAYSHVLVNIPLVVNSQRCANLALELGFNQSSILVANPAGDGGQLSCLQQWKTQYR